MNFWGTLIYAVGLSMDACAVAMTNGMNDTKMPAKRAIIIGVFFGFFQFLMPVIGFFIAGIFATSLPLLFGIYTAVHLFKFHPAIALGCCAGARTTTAAIGAMQETLGSDTPALGYTITYAVGNTLLILWGVFIVLLL